MAEPTLPADQRVSTTERLWSDEVGLARAGEPPLPTKDVAYEWSNGRTMLDGDGPYANPAA